MLCTVSLQSADSTPRIWSSRTPFMYVVGSQSYDGRSSMIAAHVRPSSVPGTYFMSMYALFEGDITTFAPCVTAGGTLSLFHCCTTVVGRNRPRPTSSQPM